MATKLSVKLTGDIDIKQDAATCPGGVTDVGQGFKIELASVNQSADLEISQKLAPVDASGGSVALPFPANLEGCVLFFSVLSGGPYDVQVTHQTQGVTTYPVRKTLLLEPSDDERITGITVLTGTGVIEWLVTGKVV
jgi:hypothetical protein